MTIASVLPIEILCLIKSELTPLARLNFNRVCCYFRDIAEDQAWKVDCQRDFPDRKFIVGIPYRFQYLNAWAFKKRFWQIAEKADISYASYGAITSFSKNGPYIWVKGVDKCQVFLKRSKGFGSNPYDFDSEAAGEDCKIERIWRMQPLKMLQYLRYGLKLSKIFEHDSKVASFCVNQNHLITIFENRLFQLHKIEERPAGMSGDVRPEFVLQYENTSSISKSLEIIPNSLCAMQDSFFLGYTSGDVQFWRSYHASESELQSKIVRVLGEDEGPLQALTTGQHHLFAASKKCIKVFHIENEALKEDPAIIPHANVTAMIAKRGVLCVGCEDGTIEVWTEAKDGLKLTRFLDDGTGGPVSCLDVSKTRIISSSGKDIKMWPKLPSK